MMTTHIMVMVRILITVLFISLVRTIGQVLASGIHIGTMGYMDFTVDTTIIIGEAVITCQEVGTEDLWSQKDSYRIRERAGRHKIRLRGLQALQGLRVERNLR